MLCQVSLKLRSRIISDTWDDRRRMFVFPRADNAWELGTKARIWLNGLVANAVSSLGVDVDPGVLRWPPGILLPSLVLHVRESRRGGRGRLGEISHEAIPHGKTLTFVILLRETDGQDRLKLPTLEELNEIMRFIGDYEGLSPYGSESGFGLFDVKSVDPVGRNDLDAGQLSGRVCGEAAVVHRQDDRTAGVEAGG